jgi:His-Xaa-Ser system protein HxsD
LLKVRRRSSSPGLSLLAALHTVLPLESVCPMPEITISIDTMVYRLPAVKKAAYRLGDRCFVQIEAPTDGRLLVRLTPKPGNTGLGALEGDFLNELLDQELRESIAEETERVRNLILAQAFSGTSLTDTVAEAADYRDDPLGIGKSQAVKH